MSLRPPANTLPSAPIQSPRETEGSFPSPEQLFTLASLHQARGVPRALQQALKVIQLRTCCLISRREERVYRKGPLAVRQGWRQPGPGDAGLETGRRGPRPNVRRRLGTASAPPGRTRRRPAAAPGRKALGAWSVWLRELSARGRARRRGGQGIAERFPRPLVWGRRPEPAGGPAQQARLPGPSSFSP